MMLNRGILRQRKKIQLISKAKKNNQKDAQKQSEALQGENEKEKKNLLEQISVLEGKVDVNEKIDLDEDYIQTGNNYDSKRCHSDTGNYIDKAKDHRIETGVNADYTATDAPNVDVLQSDVEESGGFFASIASFFSSSPDKALQDVFNTPPDMSVRVKEEDPEVLNELRDVVAKHLDHYINDILCLNIASLNRIPSDHLLNRPFIPLYIYSFARNSISTEEMKPYVSPVIALFLFYHVPLVKLLA